jgi:hypothetical protein
MEQSIMFRQYFLTMMLCTGSFSQQEMQYLQAVIIYKNYPELPTRTPLFLTELHPAIASLNLCMRTILHETN